MFPSINVVNETRNQWEHRQAFYKFSMEAHHFSVSSRVPVPVVPSVMFALPTPSRLPESVVPLVKAALPTHGLSQELLRSTSITKACPNCGFIFRVKTEEYCSKG